MNTLLAIKNKISSSFMLLWLACMTGSLAVLPYLLFILKKELTITQIIGYFFQNAIIYAITCAAGLYFSYKVGFTLILDQKDKLKQATKLLFPALLYGLLIGFSILFFELTIFKSQQALETPPWYFGLFASLYGAINEEIMSRLFLLSLVIWILQKIFKSKSKKLYWVGIITVALLFGVGHLPAAFQTMQLTTFSIFRILFLNGIAGITFGYLFWKYNLETSIFTHFLADLVLHVFYTK